MKKKPENELNLNELKQLAAGYRWQIALPMRTARCQYTKTGTRARRCLASSTVCPKPFYTIQTVVGITWSDEPDQQLESAEQPTKESFDRGKIEKCHSVGCRFDPVHRRSTRGADQPDARQQRPPIRQNGSHVQKIRREDHSVDGTCRETPQIVRRIAIRD